MDFTQDKAMMLKILDSQIELCELTMKDLKTQIAIHKRLRKEMNKS